MRARHRPRPGRRGFTLIEVMIAIIIMTFGALVIIALQVLLVRANLNARHTAQAVQIGELWLERLRQDGATWTQPGFFNSPPRRTGPQVLAGTTYLSLTDANGQVFQGIPAPADGRFPSPFFDYRGVELPADDLQGRTFFCVDFRPSWVYYGRIIRADVRVYWPRSHNLAGSSSESLFNGLTNNGANCGAGSANLHDNLDLDGDGADDISAIYLSTFVSYTPADR